MVPMVQDTLYFGRRRPDGSLVTDAEWSAFREFVLGTMFPAGFTTWAGDGHWRNAAGRSISEPCHVFQVIGRLGEHADAIQQVRARYRIRFNQESVLHASMPVTASF